MGCGQGLIGTYCLKKNAKSVHFTDYNADVIEKSLFHTLHINDVNLSMVTASSGDWSAFAEVVTEKFDYIVTSETIYNESYYPKLHAALKKASSSDTIIYIAAKRAVNKCLSDRHNLSFCSFCLHTLFAGSIAFNPRHDGAGIASLAGKQYFAISSQSNRRK